MSTSQLQALSQYSTYFSVHLNNSQLRTWEEVGNRESILQFHWDKITSNIYDQKQHIQIAVAKFFNKDDYSTIKNVAKSIKQTKEINEGDRIFGINEQFLEKVGYVTDKDVVDNSLVELKIKWISDEPIGEINQIVFSGIEELQRLTRREVNIIEDQYLNRLLPIYQQMPIGKSKESEAYERLASEPLSFDFEREQKFIKEAQVEQGGSIVVFFGTNRDRIDNIDGKAAYGTTETRELKVGTCEVHIPKKHRRGVLERPGILKRILKWPASEQKHFVIKGTKEMSELVFLDDFIKTLNEKKKKQALMFVHGYNTTFNEAAYRTAQLAWDLPFNGYTGFFSWPSAGITSSYFTDEVAARSSAPILKDFILKIASSNNLEQLHIIAHSMGGLILTVSLNLLSSEPDYVSIAEKLQQVILGAPDIDKHEFFNTILPKFQRIGRQRTLYASDGDEALNASSSFRSLRDRLGQIGSQIFVAQGIDTVDASNLKNNNNHSYIFEGKETLADIYHLVNNGLDPDQRRLREIEYVPLNYWLFPD